MHLSLIRWLRSRFFFPLAALSLFALFLRAAYTQFGDAWHGPRLIWNLTLAWAPYALSLLLIVLEQKAPDRRGLWLLILVLWLIFFPNAPYLVTDWLYLPNFKEELWFSIGLFLSFSLCGLILSLVSLYLVHGMLRYRWGHVESGAFAILVFFLSGLGIFLGRFLRLNSWDLFTHPGSVLDDLATRLHDPSVHVNPLGFSFGFALLLGVSYYVFLSIRHAPKSREEDHAWRGHHRG